MTLLSVKILGTGKYLPPTCVTSDELDVRLGLARGTMEAKTGVKSRHLIGTGRDTVASMAAHAATRALTAACTAATSLDVIVSAGASPMQLIPCNAVLIQRELGLGDSGIPAFDVDATCLSFQTALELVAAQISVGRYRRALIVSSEWASRGINWSHVESAGLFGDGAAAVVLGAAPEGDDAGILAAQMATYSQHADLCQIYGGGSALPGYEFTPDCRDRYLFQMDGPALFKQAAKLLPEQMQRLFAKAAPWRLDDLAMVIPHQASLAAMTLMRRRLGIERERWLDIVETHGNCIAASIPMALHEAVTTGRLRPGDVFLLLGTGAGISTALTLVRL